MDYTSINKIDVQSTVYRGTLYEYTVLDALSHLQFSLDRCGGADDKGVDLRGVWTLGTQPPVQVIVQCKNEAAKIGPKYIRELCGISASSSCLLVLASPRGYTPKALQAFINASQPVVLLIVHTLDMGGTLEQVIWNTAAQPFLDGLDVREVHDSAGKTRLKITFEKKALKQLRR